MFAQYLALFTSLEHGKTPDNPFPSGEVNRVVQGRHDPSDDDERTVAMARYLGVDGGGSKTAFALIDDAGSVMARATAPTSYYFNDGFDVVESLSPRVLRTSARRRASRPPTSTRHSSASPATARPAATSSSSTPFPAGVLGHDRYSCDNDMVCGWAGSLAGEDGINVISGTGSMTYGERQGVGHRVGGWGELFGDEGSAYWIAAQGLNAFSRMSDGRLPRGPLHAPAQGAPRARRRPRRRQPGDRHVGAATAATIAALATTVCRGRPTRATRRPSASSSAAVDELVTLIETTRTLVGFTDEETVPVSYSGGMFSDDGFLELFVTALQRANPPSTTCNVRCSTRRWAPRCTPPSTAAIR